MKLPLGVELGNVLHEASHGAGAGQDSVHDPSLLMARDCHELDSSFQSCDARVLSVWNYGFRVDLTARCATRTSPDSP